MTFPELLLTFSASALASVHCAAMCGGFTLSLVRPGRAGASAGRIAVYHAGKLFTYVFIGAVAGTAGAALVDNPALRSAQVIFSALAGVAIVVVGLQTLGLLPGQNIVNGIASRLWLGPFLGRFSKRSANATRSTAHSCSASSTVFCRVGWCMRLRWRRPARGRW